MLEILTQSSVSLLRAIKNGPELALGVFVLNFLLVAVLLAAWLIRVLRRSKLAKTTSKNIFSDPSLSSKAIFANAGGRESDEVYLSRRSLGELLEIENSLLALRELYQRKLIPADVYVKESQKYAESL